MWINSHHLFPCYVQIKCLYIFIVPFWLLKEFPYTTNMVAILNSSVYFSFIIFLFKCIHMMEIFFFLSIHTPTRIHTCIHTSVYTWQIKSPYLHLLGFIFISIKVEKRYCLKMNIGLFLFLRLKGQLFYSFILE